MKQLATVQLSHSLIDKQGKTNHLTQFGTQPHEMGLMKELIIERGH
jgi:Leu/Phe-tRNA-protein transferase